MSVMSLDEFRAFIDKETASMRYREAEEYTRTATANWINSLAVGDHAHICFYSDVKPCTVIARTRTTITVRRDKAKRDPSFTPEFLPGGFSAVCTNQEDQKWICQEDPDGAVLKFHLHSDGNFYNGGSSGITLYPGWVNFYDYNF